MEQWLVETGNLLKTEKDQKINKRQEETPLDHTYVSNRVSKRICPAL